MKIKILLLFLLMLGVLPAYADGDTNIILQEIRQLRIDMNQQINQVRADMNKRFEQVDKRFDQVDKHFDQVVRRFDFLQSLVYFLMGLTFASPFIAIYLKGRADVRLEKSLNRIQAVIFALKQTSQEDKRLAKALKIAGLT